MVDWHISLKALSLFSLLVVSAGFLFDSSCLNDDPCHNHGKCTFKGLDYSCECNQHWEGDFCDTRRVKTTTLRPSTTTFPPYTGPCEDQPACTNQFIGTVSCLERRLATLCPVSCKICDVPTSTEHIPVNTQPKTEQATIFTGECIENENCASFPDDICNQDVTAKICPVRCHLCNSCKDGPGCSASLAQEICNDTMLAPLCPLSCGLCSITSPASTRRTTISTPSSTTPFAIPTKPTITSASVSMTSPPSQFTPAATVIATTSQHHNTLDSAITCQTCDGPADFCEQLHKATRCEPPNNYCINHVINRSDGSRTVNRTCGNFDTCYRDWFQGSSDNDRCQTFDGSIQTLNFDCTFCCVTDNCNDQLHPPSNTLYMDF